jgi:hypothetical protein
MKITLTPALVRSIKNAIKADRDAKWQAAARVNVLTVSAKQIETLKTVYAQADAQWLAVEKMPENGTADFTAGVLTWPDVKDNRPPNWRAGWSYRVPSRSGGPDHEVVGQVYPDIRWSCNCKGSRFGEKCWAVKAVGGNNEYPHILNNTVTDENGARRPVFRIDTPMSDFGLIKDIGE